MGPNDTNPCKEAVPDGSKTGTLQEPGTMPRRPIMPPHSLRGRPRRSLGSQACICHIVLSVVVNTGLGGLPKGPRPREASQGVPGPLGPPGGQIWTQKGVKKGSFLGPKIPPNPAHFTVKMGYFGGPEGVKNGSKKGSKWGILGSQEGPRRVPGRPPRPGTPLGGLQRPVLRPQTALYGIYLSLIHI